jgi:hypothetical protein
MQRHILIETVTHQRETPSIFHCFGHLYKEVIGADPLLWASLLYKEVIGADPLLWASLQRCRRSRGQTFYLFCFFVLLFVNRNGSDAKLVSSSWKN